MSSDGLFGPRRLPSKTRAASNEQQSLILFCPHNRLSKRKCHQPTRGTHTHTHTEGRLGSLLLMISSRYTNTKDLCVWRLPPSPLPSLSLHSSLALSLHLPCLADPLCPSLYLYFGISSPPPSPILHDVLSIFHFTLLPPNPFSILYRRSFSLPPSLPAFSLAQAKVWVDVYSHRILGRVLRLPFVLE